MESCWRLKLYSANVVSDKKSYNYSLIQSYDKNVLNLYIYKLKDNIE